MTIIYDRSRSCDKCATKGLVIINFYRLRNAQSQLFTLKVTVTSYDNCFCRSRSRSRSRSRQRSRSRSADNEDLDDEDMDLIQENLGVKFQKKRYLWVFVTSSFFDHSISTYIYLEGKCLYFLCSFISFYSAIFPLRCLLFSFCFTLYGVLLYLQSLPISYPISITLCHTYLFFSYSISPSSL